MRASKTQRGFDVIYFEDLYGNECSLQKSSSAFQHNIWLGQNKSAFISGTGEPLSPRMHLSRRHVLKLLPRLILFVLTGRITFPWENRNGGES